MERILSWAAVAAMATIMGLALSSFLRACILVALPYILP